MEFSEFSALLTQWCDAPTASPLDCWIDGANARLAMDGYGVRCSIDLLDPWDASDPQRLAAVLEQGGASLACSCDGALGIDPESRCVVLVTWLADPCLPENLLNCLERLANQRAAMLALMNTALRVVDDVSTRRRNSLNPWQPGV